MEMVEKGLTKGSWYEGAKCACGDVTVELEVLYRVTGGVEGRGLEEGGNIGAVGLLLGKLKGGKRWDICGSERADSWWGMGSGGCFGRGGWAGEGIRNHVGGARGVDGSEGKFRKKSQLALLAAGFGWGETVEGRNKRFVVSVELEWASFQVGTEMEEGRIGSKEFPVKCGVFLLGGGELGREEGEGLPVVEALLLEDGTNVGIRGIGGNGEVSSRVGVGKKGGMGKGVFGSGEGGGHSRGPGEGFWCTGEGVSERTKDGSSMREESAIEVDEAKESLEILDGGGLRVGLDGGHVGLKGSDAGGGDVVSEKIQRGLG